MDNNQLALQLTQLLEEFKDKLPETDFENIKDFIDNNEYGLAYETLCTQLDEYSVQISYALYEKFTSIGISMKIDSSLWLPLRDLITPPINKNNSERI